MANVYPAKSFGEIEINGEKYTPRPHEVNPELFSEDGVWSQVPWNPRFLEDPEWYNSMGEDQIKDRRIWAVPTEQGQTEQILQLLREFPSRAFDLLFAAAAKGKPHVIRALLHEGVGETDDTKRDEDGITALHAAAFQGHLDCVKILVKEGHVDVNAADNVGGTPLMRASVGANADIVSYLLAEGADIFLRETRDHFFSTFDLAVFGGSLDCVNLLVQHAGDRAGEFFTSQALEAAAASDKVEMLNLVLKGAGYPMPSTEASAGETLSLSDVQKTAIEAALARAASQACFQVLPLFLSYLESHSSEGVPNFNSLNDSTYEALGSALWDAAEGKGVNPLGALDQIYHLTFSDEPRFASDDVRQIRVDIVQAAFILAAARGHLDAMKALLELYPELDANYVTSRAGLQSTTALYEAAHSARMDVLNWLFDTFDATLDVHMGIGKFINGPTALMITVVRRHIEATKLLLKRGGGPVDDIEADLGPKLGEPATKVVLTIRQTRRTPARMINLDTFKREIGKDQVATYGIIETESKEGLYWVVFEVGEEDLEWWEGMKPRDNDEALLERETRKPNGERLRELKPKPDEEASGTAAQQPLQAGEPAS